MGRNLADRIEKPKVFLPPEIIRPDDNLSLKEIGIKELERELLLINTRKSSGLDNVSATVLKDFLIGRKKEFCMYLTCH